MKAAQTTACIRVPPPAVAENPTAPDHVECPDPNGEPR